MTFLARGLHSSNRRSSIFNDAFEREENGMASSDFILQLEGYGLTTANILYRLPDYPKIIQSYVWQDYDLHPHFPELRKFLAFWARSLDGPLHHVTVAHSHLIKPAELRLVDGEFRVH
jgi:uncharacterized protein Usg